MNTRTLLGAALVALAVLSAVPAAVAQDADDGLEPVRSKRFAEAYLLPGADFRPYSRVLVEPVSVSFKPGWLHEVGSATGSRARPRLTEQDLARMEEWLAADLARALEKALADAGFELATGPGPDVLRITPRLREVFLNAPESAGEVAPMRQYARRVGEATIVLEARDSELGVLLGRAIDRRWTTDRDRLELVNETINRSEFGRLFDRWARRAAEGLQGLQAASAVVVQPTR